MKNKRKMLYWAAAAAYGVLMFALLFLRKSRYVPGNYAALVKQSFFPIPFDTTRRYVNILLNNRGSWIAGNAAVNLFGNIFMFMPMGILPPLLTDGRTKFRHILVYTAGIITVVELTQMLLLVGMCDIDDVILNVLGAAIGYGIYKFGHIIKNRQSA